MDTLRLEDRTPNARLLLLAASLCVLIGVVMGALLARADTCEARAPRQTQGAYARA